MKKLHLALSVANIEDSVLEYSQKLNHKPDLVIENTYALWRTDHLNLSIRKVNDAKAGELRHLGFEVENAEEFVAQKDCNGILWEHFDAKLQAQEINETWPDVNYKVKATN